MSAQPRSDDKDIVPALRPSSISGGPGDIEKEEVFMAEDVKEILQYERNTPEEILSRYPLLRDKSEQELAKLNNRIKRLM